MILLQASRSVRCSAEFSASLKRVRRRVLYVPRQTLGQVVKVRTLTIAKLVGDARELQRLAPYCHLRLPYAAPARSYAFL